MERRGGGAGGEVGATRRHALCLVLLLGAAYTTPARAQPPHVEPAAPTMPEPDYLRAFLENTALLGVGTAWYWLDDRNVVDWDFTSLTRFDEDAYRFDNNEFPLNFVGHPLAGAAYYGLPRANRLGLYASFAYGLLTSFVWEFFLEFKERFSVNDFIVTPLGGLPIGEGFIRLGRWLDSSAHPALAWTLGFPVAIHEALDGRSVGRDGPEASDEDPGHAEVLIDYGGAWAIGSGDASGPGFDVHRIGASASFVALESYRQPGQTVRGFFDGEVTRLRMDALVSSIGAGFEIEADTMFLGLHVRDLSGTRERLSGSSALIGTSVSHFLRFENFDRWHERLSYTGFPGLALQLEEHLAPVLVGFDLRAQAIFGAATANYELSRWLRRHPGETPKSVLTSQQYWYGWGWVARGEFTLGVGPVQMLARGRYVVLDSQEGYDRNEDRVTFDADGYAQLLESILELRVVLVDLVALRARWTHQQRLSQLSEVRTSRGLDRFELGAGLTF